MGDSQHSTQELAASVRKPILRAKNRIEYLVRDMAPDVAETYLSEPAEALAALDRLEEQLETLRIAAEDVSDYAAGMTDNERGSLSALVYEDLGAALAALASSPARES